jgi:uncharacterized membrane protein
MEARGNKVVFKYESPEETSVHFPSISMLCSVASRPDVELVLAAVNRGATAAELFERFALGEAPAPIEVAAAATTEDAPAPPESPAPAATPEPPAPPQESAAPEVPAASTPPTPAPAPNGDGSSAALAVRLADTELNVSLGATGLDLQSLLGGIALLGVGVMLVIVLRLPGHR